MTATWCCRLEELVTESAQKRKGQPYDRQTWWRRSDEVKVSLAIFKSGNALDDHLLNGGLKLRMVNGGGVAMPLYRWKSLYRHSREEYTLQGSR
jgi:hypothetical protein